VNKQNDEDSRTPAGLELESLDVAMELGIEEAPADIGFSLDEMEEHHGVVSKQPV